MVGDFHLQEYRVAVLNVFRAFASFPWLRVVYYNIKDTAHQVLCDVL